MRRQDIGRACNWLTVAVVLGFIAQAVAGPFEDAGAAHKRADYATEFKLLSPLAEAGNPDAQYNLGVLYDKGLRVPKDSTAAMKWFRKAAAHGNALAALGIGVMYAKGEGVVQDFFQARVWFFRAVERIPESDAAHHATAVDYGDRAAAHLSAEQITAAKRLARSEKLE